MATEELAFASAMSPGPSSQEPTAIGQLLEVAAVILRQALDLVDNQLRLDEQLTTQSKYLPGSTIGKHLRHARDHFTLLLECVSSPPPHILNYDIRSRNTPMETSLKAARQSLLETIDRLNEVVPGVAITEPITLNAVTPYMQVLETTFGRELWFASHHCVHHWSAVRVICGELNIQLSDDFGVAPSTLLYQGKEAPLGKAKI